MADKALLRAPALIPAAGATCGILAVAADTATGLAVSALIAVAALLTFRFYKGAPAVFAGAFVIFAALTAIEAPKLADTGGAGAYRGVVTRWQTHGASQSGLVRLADGTLIDVAVTDLTPAICTGDSVAFSGRVLPAGRYKGVDGMEAARMAELARRSGGSVVLNSHEIGVTGRSNALRYRFDRMRRHLADCIYSSELSPDAARLLTSACLGTGDVDHRLRDDMRVSGLAHLLCISGFHVGLVALLIGLLLWPLSQVWRRPERYLINLSAVWLYVMLTGATPPVVRAAVMLTVYYLVRIFGRNSNAVNSLAVAFVAVLALYPYSLFSAGFQLSFCAVAGIICFAQKLNPIPGRYRTARAIAGTATVAVGATLGTLPVMLWWFGRVPLLGVPLNVAATVLFPLFLILASLALPFDSGLPARGADTLYDTMSAWLNSATDAVGTSQLELSARPAAIAAAIIAVTAIAIIVHKRGLRLRIGATAIALAAVITAACLPHKAVPTGIIVDSSRFSTDIITLDGDRSALYISGKKPARNYAGIFSRHGISPDTLALQAYTDSPAAAIACVGRHHSEPSPAPIALLLPGFRGDKAEAIAATGAHTLLLSASLDSREAAEGRSIAERLGMALHDVAEKPFCRIAQNE